MVGVHTTSLSCDTVTTLYPRITYTNTNDIVGHNKPTSNYWIINRASCHDYVDINVYMYIFKNNAYTHNYRVQHVHIQCMVSTKLELSRTYQHVVHSLCHKGL